MSKSRICGTGSGAVVRTTTLTLVTAENPTVQIYLIACVVALLFDCQTRDAATCVNTLCRQNCAIGTRLDAASALSAARPFEGGVVAINLGVNDQLSEEYKGAELGRYE